MSPSLEEVLRIEGGQVLATLVRFTRDWDLAEDALQDALVVAVEKWATDGVPDNPVGWLTTVARNKALDRIRRESRRPKREIEAVVTVLGDETMRHRTDDTLRLIFTCCHPALSREAGVALTLRTVAGLSTVEIARAFVVPEATIGQRISRAKRKIATAKIPYRIPPDHELPARLSGVLVVLNVVFTVGHHAPVGRLDQRVDLAAEAIRLTRLLVNLMPDEPEAWGLLALMVATHARRDARLDRSGDLVLLPDQDRGRWHAAEIAEAESILLRVLRRRQPGPFQTQAAIAALHSAAASAEETDWPQIAVLYRMLERQQPSPIVTVNRAVAESRVAGPLAGLAVLDTVAGFDRWHLYWAARAALLAESGDHGAAAEAYRSALACRPNESDERFLRERLRESSLRSDASRSPESPPPTIQDRLV
ncbi:MAG: RNA polymerase sigma factor [Nocardioides sp.]